MPELQLSEQTAASEREYTRLAGERRDTDRAIALWHQKARDLGWPPPIEAFDLSRVASDWGYRFIVCGDDMEDAVFLLYGLQFARVLRLPEKPNHHVPIIGQLPERYQQVFADGCGEAIKKLIPVRFSDSIEHAGSIEYYRAAFLPVKLQVNSRKPIVFGSFNCRGILRASQ
jgi:hypothetical protein